MGDTFRVDRLIAVQNAELMLALESTGRLKLTEEQRAHLEQVLEEGDLPELLASAVLEGSRHTK